MVFPQELLDYLAALSSGPWQGVAYRHVLGTNAALAENTGGARWNPPGVPTIYLALERDTAVAEGDHALTVQPIRPGTDRWIYSVRAELGNVLDLSDRAALSKTGVGDAELTSDNHFPCRLVGGAAAWLGHDGILVPSARHSGINLAVYAGNLDPKAYLEADANREHL